MGINTRTAQNVMYKIILNDRKNNSYVYTYSIEIVYIRSGTISICASREQHKGLIYKLDVSCAVATVLYQKFQEHTYKNDIKFSTSTKYV